MNLKFRLAKKHLAWLVLDSILKSDISIDERNSGNNTLKLN